MLFVKHNCMANWFLFIVANHWTEPTEARRLIGSGGFIVCMHIHVNSDCVTLPWRHMNTTKSQITTAQLDCQLSCDCSVWFQIIGQNPRKKGHYLDRVAVLSDMHIHANSTDCIALPWRQMSITASQIASIFHPKLSSTKSKGNTYRNVDSLVRCDGNLSGHT